MIRRIAGTHSPSHCLSSQLRLHPFSRRQAQAADPRVGSSGASCHEPHQRAPGHVGFFLPEAGGEAVFIAGVDNAREVRLDVGNRHQLALSLSGLFLQCSGVVVRIAVLTRVRVEVSSSWLLPPPPPWSAAISPSAWNSYPPFSSRSTTSPP